MADSPTLCAALVQLVSGSSPQVNLARCQARVEEAAGRGAELVVLPEMCLTFGRLQSYGVEEQRSWIAALSSLSARHNVWLVAGTLPLHAKVLQPYRSLPNDPRPYAACLVFEPSGEVADVYCKLHMFDVIIGDQVKRYRESRDYAAGDAVVSVDTPWGRLGLAVCYDLRFPVMFDALAASQPAMIAIPSAFTAVTGRAHWETLVRARAIETQSFVLAANQGGYHENLRETWGHSMVVNPWGEIESKHAQGEAVVLSHLPLEQVAKIRRDIPLQHHRRFARHSHPFPGAGTPGDEP